MDYKVFLTSKLLENIRVDKEKLIYSTYEIAELKLQDIRDCIFALGHIIQESVDENFYVASMKVFGNVAYMALSCSDEILYIVSYSREGIVKQKTEEKAREKLIVYIKNLKKGKQ